MSDKFRSFVISADILSPCKNCNKRSDACHSKCEHYLKFVAEKRVANEKQRYKNCPDNFSLEWRRGSLLERINRKNGK